MAARTDFSKYANGVETLENFIPLPEGGAMRRSGSRFVREVKDSSKKSRLKRFEFSTEQAYIIEWADFAFRFFRNQGQILVADVETQVQNGTFTTDLSAWSDNSGDSSSISHNSTDNRMTLDGTSVSDVASAEQEIIVPTASANREHALKVTVVGTANNHVRLKIGTATGLADIVDHVDLFTGYHVYSFTPTGNFFLQFEVHEDQAVDIDNISIIQTGALEIDTPYAIGDVFKLDGPQSADLLYLFHKTYPVYKLSRFSDTSWSLVLVNWQDGPYLDSNIDTSLTLQPSAAAVGPDVTVSASGHGPFKKNDKNRVIRINNAADGVNYGWGIITEVVGAHEVKIDVIRAFQTANAAWDWALGAWSANQGYPGAATFFEQRLWPMGSASFPQTIWPSNTGDFEDMSPDDSEATVANTDALNYTIVADDVNAILWGSPGLDLVIGTTGGEWVPESLGAAITPTDFSVKRHTKHGSAQVQPVRNGHTVLFLQKALRKIREFSFHFEVDGNRAFDMTRLARHATTSGVVQMDFAQEPNSQLLCTRTDGQIAAMTHLRDEDIVGWSRHVLGGAFGTGAAVVESVATIPGNATTNSIERDEVWMIVKRTINGVTKRYVEFWEKQYDLDDGDNQEDAFYVDSGATYEGSATQDIGGLTHLIGETVQVWGDGAIQPEVVVNPEGEVKLQQAVSKAQIGLEYNSTLKTLKLEGGNQRGTAVGKNKRFDALTLVVMDSHTAEIGPDPGTLIQFDFRDVADPMDAGTPLFTGEKRLEFEGDFERDSRIIVKSVGPAPFTLLGLAPEAEVNV